MQHGPTIFLFKVDHPGPTCWRKPQAGCGAGSWCLSSESPAPQGRDSANHPHLFPKWETHRKVCQQQRTCMLKAAVRSLERVEAMTEQEPPGTFCITAEAEQMMAYHWRGHSGPLGFIWDHLSGPESPSSRLRAMCSFPGFLLPYASFPKLLHWPCRGLTIPTAEQIHL